MVDCREPLEIMNALALKHNTKIVELQTGDYCVGEILGVERKSWDFLNFGDLFVKIDELRNFYEKPYLIVCRNPAELIDAMIKRNRDIPPQQHAEKFWGVCASCTMRGVPPIFCGSDDMFPIALSKLIKKALDGKDRRPELKALRPHNARPLLTKYDRHIHLLSGIEGVSDAKAYLLLSHFGTPERVFGAKPEELLKIKGVGEKLVLAIQEAIR